MLTSAFFEECNSWAAILRLRRVQCANLRQWFSDHKKNQLALESFFMTGYVKHYWKCTKSNLVILQIFAI